MIRFGVAVVGELLFGEMTVSGVDAKSLLT
jgi:hypothetical protein